jgi:hypothetical protein
VFAALNEPVLYKPESDTHPTNLTTNGILSSAKSFKIPWFVFAVP